MEETVHWMKDLFGTAKPVIGLLHLLPLPGDPFFAPSGSLSGVIERAKRDLDALQSGGVDGVLITNEFSLPYEKKVSPVTLAAMGTVVGALLDSMSLPFGAEAIYDGDATIELCAGTGSLFTRCMFTGAWAGDLGLIDRDIAQTLRCKAALRQDDLKLFYFVTSEGEVYLNDRTTTDIAKSMLFNVRPDAFVVGGSAPGQSPGAELLSQVKAVSGEVPVVCGTGCRQENAREMLAASDGAFVGTSFKVDGLFENPIDPARVAAFMQHVRSFRED